MVAGLTFHQQQVSIKSSTGACYPCSYFVTVEKRLSSWLSELSKPSFSKVFLWGSYSNCSHRRDGRHSWAFLGNMDLILFNHICNTQGRVLLVACSYRLHCLWWVVSALLILLPTCANQKTYTDAEASKCEKHFQFYKFRKVLVKVKHQRQMKNLNPSTEDIGRKNSW